MLDSQNLGEKFQVPNTKLFQMLISLSSLAQLPPNSPTMDTLTPYESTPVELRASPLGPSASSGWDRGWLDPSRRGPGLGQRSTAAGAAPAAPGHRGPLAGLAGVRSRRADGMGGWGDGGMDGHEGWGGVGGKGGRGT